MFRKLLLKPKLIPIYNKRFFSSCNNRCNVDEVTSNLIRQERYVEIINKKIGMLKIMSFVNIMFSMIF
jgi:hypothetical protein